MGDYRNLGKGLALQGISKNVYYQVFEHNEGEIYFQPWWNKKVREKIEQTLWKKIKLCAVYRNMEELISWEKVLSSYNVVFQCPPHIF